MANSKRMILVVRADMVGPSNLAAREQDTGDVGGERTFTVPLSASGTPPAQAYWCNWQMRPAQATAIRARLRGRGATVAETAPVPFGQVPASNRFAVFDTDEGWTPETVLVAVGLRRVDTTP